MMRVSGSCYRCALVGMCLVTIILWNRPSLAGEYVSEKKVTGQSVSADVVGSEKTQREVIEVYSDEELSEAFGLVILEPESAAFGVEQTKQSDGQGAYSALSVTKPTVRRRPAFVRKREGGRWDIIVRLEPEDYRPSSKLTVVATTSSGKTIAGNVRWLAEPEQFSEPEVTLCRMDTTSRRLKILLGLSHQGLGKLIAVRRQKKEILKKLLKSILVPELFDRLNAFEQELGISNMPPMTIRTPHDKLAQRLGVIQVLLKSRSARN